MSALEDRLRTELSAESEMITLGSLPDLRLPEPARRRLAWPTGRARRARQESRPWPPWIKPLAAAAAVIMVIVGTVVVVRSISSTSPLPTAAATYSGAPAYYAYLVQGDLDNHVVNGKRYSTEVTGRWLEIRDTATGKLLASLAPPGPDNDFSVLTAAANGSMFVAGAIPYTKLPGHNHLVLDPAAPTDFELLQVTARGHVKTFPLSLPMAVTQEQGGPSIALSPDASRLAVAYDNGGTGVVQVITLATGSMWQWTLPAHWMPVVQADGAWAADGRTLVVRTWHDVTQLKPVGWNGIPSTFHPLSVVSLFPIWLLDTAVPASQQGASRRLPLRSLAGQSAVSQPFITPNGDELIAPFEIQDQRDLDILNGGLAVYSTRDGALLHTLATWRWTLRSGGSESAQPLVAWSSFTGSQLVLMQPRADQNVLGTFTGGTFQAPGSALAPGPSAGYQELRDALRATTQMAW